MKVFISILVLLNFVVAKDGFWVNVKNSKPIYKEVKRVIPQKVCREYNRQHKHKVVKRCKNYDKVIYENVLYGYENSVNLKSNGQKYKLNFFTNDKVFQVKVGILDYR